MVANKGLITVSIMLATIMQVLDTTIANVALPSMQGSLGAAQDQITWVLTSYIVASAIMTPVTGWLSDRMGLRELFIASVAGFVVTSMLCGMATSLAEMVVFRTLQGICGAALVPLSQTVLLNINPREEHGRAMAIWGAGIMVGPIIGPTLGGWLTETFDWRFVFFVNLPVGLLALAGLIAFLPRSPKRQRSFDFFGFAMLSLAIGALAAHARPRRAGRLVRLAGDLDRPRADRLRALGLRDPHHRPRARLHRPGDLPRRQPRDGAGDDLHGRA